MAFQPLAWAAAAALVLGAGLYARVLSLRQRAPAVATLPAEAARDLVKLEQAGSEPVAGPQGSVVTTGESVAVAEQQVAAAAAEAVDPGARHVAAAERVGLVARSVAAEQPVVQREADELRVVEKQAERPGGRELVGRAAGAAGA
ncbi:MAG: hypothetical protein HY337_02890, partial [Gemmatimonadetes bacterium]|nr:hypothetical protein [Gemmatimonadota bacterium]